MICPGARFSKAPETPYRLCGKPRSKNGQRHAHLLVGGKLSGQRVNDQQTVCLTAENLDIEP